MKKALIITYYWPPSGGAGVQRWLKFVKYLRDSGWEPIVYTPENPESPTNDPSLEKDIPRDITILKTEIWEPYSWYKRLIGQKKDDKINAAFLSESEKPKMMERFSVWVRGNFFVPDARIFWVKPSIKYLSAYLAKNPVDVIISTGPPHSMHLIAAGLKKKLNIPWLADFRDPWTNIDFYSKLKLGTMADTKHHRLELNVLQQSDAITCVGRTMIEEFKQILKGSPEKANSDSENKFHFIPNGFDPEDYKNEAALNMDKKFSMSHIGMLDKTRNPEVLWKVLAALVKNNPAFAADLEIKLVGKTDFAVNRDIEKYGLSKYLTKIPYLSHHEVTLAQKQSQVLLLLINNTPNALGIITGKFFEYMAAQRPILCIGPSGGDVDKILTETNSGYLSGYTDVQALEKNILALYDKFKKGTLSSESKNIEKYSRKELTHELANVLNTIAK